VRPDEQVAMANVLARHIKQEIPKTHGFCLFLFPHSSQPGSALTTYIASVERADMRHELRLILAKWDADELAGSAMPTSSKSLGQVAYEAYCEKAGWKSLVTGAPLPTWSQQRPEISQAWEAAAAAVKASR
jgi:hypothetical protein